MLGTWELVHCPLLPAFSSNSSVRHSVPHGVQCIPLGNLLSVVLRCALQALDRLAAATSELPNVAVSVLEWDDAHLSALASCTWDLLLGRDDARTVEDCCNLNCYKNWEIS